MFGTPGTLNFVKKHECVVYNYASLNSFWCNYITNYRGRIFKETKISLILHGSRRRAQLFNNEASSCDLVECRFTVRGLLQNLEVKF